MWKEQYYYAQHNHHLALFTSKDETLMHLGLLLSAALTFIHDTA